MGWRKATRQDVLRWKAMRDGGMTFSAIAKECGVKEALVYRWLTPGYHKLPPADRDTDEENQEIIDLWKAGHTIPDICRKVETTNSRVTGVLQRAGLRQRTKRNTMTRRQDEMIEAMLDQGLTYEHIARAVGCSPATVAARYRSRKPTIGIGSRSKMIGDLRPAMVEMRRQHMTVAAIARSLGIGTETVRRHLHDMGVM